MPELKFIEQLKNPTENISDLWTPAEVNADLLEITAALQQSDFFLNHPPQKRENLVNLLRKLGVLNMACQR